jgi:hypothetical protein
MSHTSDSLECPSARGGAKCRRMSLNAARTARIIVKIPIRNVALFLGVLNVAICKP